MAEGFLNVKMIHLPEVIASAIAWMLTDNEQMMELLDNYFKHLGKKREKKDA